MKIEYKKELIKKPSKSKKIESVNKLGNNIIVGKATIFSKIITMDDGSGPLSLGSIFTNEKHARMKIQIANKRISL